MEATLPLPLPLLPLGTISYAAAPSSPGKAVATTGSVPDVSVELGLGPTENVVLKAVTLFAQVAVAWKYF